MKFILVMHNKHVQVINFVCYKVQTEVLEGTKLPTVLTIGQ
jgi:hypothetical protein